MDGAALSAIAAVLVLLGVLVALFVGIGKSTKEAEQAAKPRVNSTKKEEQEVRGWKREGRRGPQPAWRRWAASSHDELTLLVTPLIALCHAGSTCSSYRETQCS
jgi:hypothetical protein